MCRMHAPPATPATRPPPRRSWQAGGFSLIEAVAVVAVTAIVAVIGVPSYQSLSERTRTGAALHLLASHMYSARNTAITYRIPTVVCPSNGAGGCRNDSDWTQGWLMFFDKDGNQRPDTPADILREDRAPLHPSLRMVATQGHKQLRYQPDGRSSGSNLSVRLCRNDILLGKVVVNNTGRVRTEKVPGSKPCMSN